EIEKRVHHFLKAKTIAMNDSQQLARFRGQFGGVFAIGLSEKLLDWAEHQRNRSAEFVADIAEEDGLGPVQLGESVCTSLFVFGCAGVVNGADELIDDEAEECEVFGIELARRVDSANEEAKRRDLGGRGNRQHDRFHDRLASSAER